MNENTQRAPRLSWALWPLAILVAAGLGCYAARHTVDFPVYYQTVHAWRAQGGPIYGPNSGLGWPMYYRYPPLFLLCFLPWSWLPLTWAQGLWAAGKVIALTFLVRALAARLALAAPAPPVRAWPRWLAPLLLAGTYLLVEFRYGNVQFYVFALVAAALLMLPGRWRGASLLLALAAAIKVWPLFFIPYLWARGRGRAAALTLGSTAALTLLPALVWGWSGNWQLLRQWAGQERATALVAGSIWYPSQSLRGVLSRYLIAGQGARAVSAGYPAVHIAAWSAPVVTVLWLALAALLYAWLLWKAGRQRRERAAARASALLQGLTLDGLAFCLLALIMPFLHVEDLVVLLWPGMVAGVLLTQAKRRPGPAFSLLWAAVILAGVIPLLPGHWTQRWLQAAGADFVVVCCLTAGLAGWRWESRAPQAEEAPARSG